MKKLDIVGFGPGGVSQMTKEAYDAIEACDIVVGFSTYTNLIKTIFPDKEFFSNGMGKEVQRTRAALALADSDKHVCLVCSGDSSVYGMAGLAYELSNEYPDVSLNTIAGVTAALSGGALLGAACGNDICLISLSDYHTEWSDIVKRLVCVAECDFVIALYNPCSKARPDSLKNACDMLLTVIPESRICGVAENIGREDEKYTVLTLKDLRDFNANMFSTVFIGNSKTININGKMVTPRGYRLG